MANNGSINKTYYHKEQLQFNEKSSDFGAISEPKFIIRKYNFILAIKGNRSDNDKEKNHMTTHIYVSLTQIYALLHVFLHTYMY